MKKDFDNILNEVQKLHKELEELKKLVLNQNARIEDLKKQLEAVTTVKIEEDGNQSVESYGNLILDEIVSIKKKLDSISKDHIANACKLEDGAELDKSFSLSDLKDELIKLADMMAD